MSEEMPRRGREPELDEDELDGDGEDRTQGSTRISRAERNRVASEVTTLGIELSKLSQEDLDRLDLPERVREEIDHGQRLKPRARGRQNRLIGQLLRAEDFEEVRQQLTGLLEDRRFTVQHEKVNERWRDRLIEEGDPAVEALIADHPSADRQRIRQLVRTARAAAETPRARRASRELLRAIRELRA